jgi:transposase InsO family protein
MFTVLDEYTREALCVAVRPKMNANDVLETLHPRLIKHGKPEFIRSDNGPEFIATHLQDWLKKVGIKPMQIHPGSPWENGYNERFNGTLRKEVLNTEWFHTTLQAQVAINVWLRAIQPDQTSSRIKHAPTRPRNPIRETKN